VSGCPEPRPDHAQCCVEMGLAMVIAIDEFDLKHNQSVKMRVGVHTGSVLCGLVGTRRFKFDVWSHDVTLANMMESEGEADKVHVSDDTKKFISDLYEMTPGRDVNDIRKHKELIEQYDRATGQYVVTSVEKRNLSSPKMKTWFIVRRLFEPPAAAVVSAASIADSTTVEVAGGTVSIEVENSVVGDGVSKDQAENKDLSAVQLLGKRDHMMTSHEELNGEASGTSGTMGPRTTVTHDDFDRQLIECMKDETINSTYNSNHKINQCTLSFTKSKLESEYRLYYDDSSSQPSETQLTLAMPRYSGLCDVIISFLFFLLVIVCCFVGFSIRVLWVIICIVGITFEAVLLLPMFSDVCLAHSRIRSSLIRRLSGWYPRHLFGIIVTSLPSVAAYSAMSCAMFGRIDSSDQFYCLLVVTTLLHYCNFTMLSSWMKSVLATGAGLVLLILIGIGFCKQPVAGSCGGLDCNTTTVMTVNATSGYNASNWGNEIFSGNTPLQYEIILDVALLLLLVWFLNREIEISYRLCYHGDVQAASDRQKIQFEKEQADWLLHNIVPEHVAHLLKTHEVYSENHKNVGIIFAKICNFDDFYDEAYEGGKEYLRVLNELMGDFEELFDSPKYKDVEKIKTIGACLMAASGLNTLTRQQNNDPIAHLYALMDFSLDLLKKLDQFNKDMLSFKFEMEIGYNFGNVTAGVVGTTKLLYDIWGDAVNVASRMYSTGVHGRIQVTKATAELLSEKFDFEHRGSVFVKGKGDLETYLVVRKKDGAAWN
jgi:adenylate cyclase 9